MGSTWGLRATHKTEKSNSKNELSLRILAFLMDNECLSTLTKHKKKIASLKTFGMNQYIDGYKNKNKDHNHNDFFWLLGTIPRRSISAMINMKLFINKIA